VPAGDVPAAAGAAPDRELAQQPPGAGDDRQPHPESDGPSIFTAVQEQLGLTYVFISHDLAVAEYFCDRVAVLYLGQVMELADREVLFRKPLHPYSVSLLSAVPVPQAGGRGRRAQRAQPIGEISSIVDRPKGCPFEPRCPVGRGRGVCSTSTAGMIDSGEIEMTNASGMSVVSTELKLLVTG